MPACLIIGIDNHVGAYLARLLDARGIALAGVGGEALVARLGIAAAVTPVADDDAPLAAGDARLIFAINSAAPGRSALIAECLARAEASARPPRVLHVADAAAATLPAVRAATRQIAEARAANRLEAANVVLAAHDSRLGPADSLMARITSAAWRAGRAETPPIPAIDIDETGQRDWGWTPEYVDAVQRLAAQPSLVDCVVASGHSLSAADIAAHAFAFFRRDVDASVRIHGTGDKVVPPDPAPINAATGWSASTYGRDLVRAICEGAADRG